MIVLCSRMPLESGFPVCKGTEAEARVRHDRHSTEQIVHFYLRQW